jgi:hypothetical protein
MKIKMPMYHKMENNVAATIPSTCNQMAPSPSPSPDPDPTPRKRKITARIRDNADPLLPRNKKARAQAKEKAVKPSTSKADTLKARNLAKAQVPRNHPVDVEGAQHDKGAGLDPKDVDPIEQAVADAIDVDKVPSDATTEISDAEAEPEAAEESCEAELSKRHIYEVVSELNLPDRASVTGVDIAHLRVLPRDPHCQIYPWASRPCFPMSC